MNPVVERAITDYLARVNWTDFPGKLISAAEVQELQSRLFVPLPDWYIQILSTYPLAGAYFDYPIYEPEGDFDGHQDIKIATPDDIFNETDEAYPGLAIRELGYVCLATDPTGGGDPYFMKIKDGDNPAVYQVYHDVSDIGSVIEQEGMLKIADSLAEFFEKARVKGKI